jgi:LuxR family maltose regulon positive regulatory protein
VVRGTADMHVGISGVAWERNQLATAAAHLHLGRELGDAAGLPQHPYRRRVAEARLLAARGDLPSAVARLDEADQVFFGDFSPNVRPVPAQRARLHLACGDLASAVSWAHAHDLTPEDELTYLHEFEHITLAMVLLAQHRAGRSPSSAQEAIRLLERLLDPAVTGGRDGNVIEILVQLALASQSVGDRSRATDLLGRALTLAEREGHVRVFLDAGPGSTALLRSIGPDALGGEHAQVVLAAAADPATSHAAVVPSSHPEVAPEPLLDPLSPRELDVLHLLDSDLGGPDIARQLSVSVNTVRTHIRHIYAKLGATTRREAVREAARRGLLRHSGH